MMLPDSEWPRLCPGAGFLDSVSVFAVSSADAVPARIVHVPDSQDGSFEDSKTGAETGVVMLAVGGIVAEGMVVAVAAADNGVVKDVELDMGV